MVSQQLFATPHSHGFRALLQQGRATLDSGIFTGSASEGGIMRHPARASGGGKLSLTKSPSTLQREIQQLREQLSRRTEEQRTVENYWRVQAEAMYVQAQRFHEHSVAAAADLHRLSAEHQARCGTPEGYWTPPRRASLLLRSA